MGRAYIGEYLSSRNARHKLGLGQGRLVSATKGIRKIAIFIRPYGRDTEERGVGVERNREEEVLHESER